MGRSYEPGTVTPGPTAADRAVFPRWARRPAALRLAGWATTHGGDRDRGADQALRQGTGIEDVTLRSRRARSSASSAPTGRARRRRSARCSTCSTRAAASPASSASTAAARASRSAPGSATCPATSATASRPAGARRCGCSPACAVSTGPGRADALAERFQADLDRPLGQLSRGNRQKIGLILATFHSPELLILDEPTSGLDPLMQEEFLALVAEERERGATVLLSSHELDEVERVCDRVGIVREGRLIAVERVADLLAKAGRRTWSRSSSPSRSSWRTCGRCRASQVESGEDGQLPLRRRPRPRVKALAAHHVIDLEFARPTLEQVFLTYYDEGEEMSAQLAALVGAHLSDRRRSLLAWGIPLGLWSAFVVVIFPSVEGALSKAVESYPEALKEAFGIGQLTTVEQYLQAEMLSLIVPLALGYLAVRAIASGLSGAAESGRLDVLLSAPVSRRAPGCRRLRRDRDRAGGGAAHHRHPHLPRQPGRRRRPLLRPGPRRLRQRLAAGTALRRLRRRRGGFSLRTSVVTGAVVGLLVTMYVIDLIGKLDTGLSGIRYVSVFKYYGNAIEDGIDPLAFVGVTLAVLLTALGAVLSNVATSRLTCSSPASARE